MQKMKKSKIKSWHVAGFYNFRQNPLRLRIFLKKNTEFMLQITIQKKCKKWKNWKIKSLDVAGFCNFRQNPLRLRIFLNFFTQKIEYMQPNKSQKMKKNEKKIPTRGGFL